MTQHSRVSWRDEGGATAVLVVLSLFVLLGVAALAVDAGSLWMTKRNFVTDTDAAALAGARAASDEVACADKTSEATAEAQAYLAHNQGGTISGTPNVAVDCAADTVTVDFTGQAPMTFAGALGFSQLDVFSSSTANFDNRPLSLLRPLATCITNPQLLTAVIGESAPALTIGFTNNKDGLGDCGSPSGNWGWLCFAENCGSSDEIDCDDPKGTSGFLRCGVDPGLDLGATPTPGPPYVAPYTAHDEICYSGGDTDDWCVTKPGSKNSLQSGGPQGSWPVDAALEQRVFPILLIDQYSPDRNGRTEAHPKALLWVRFDGYCIDPSKTRQWPNTPWPSLEAEAACKGNEFAFKLAPLHIQWSVDEQLPGFILDVVPAAIRICGVDHDPDGGTRC